MQQYPNPISENDIKLALNLPDLVECDPEKFAEAVLLLSSRLPDANFSGWIFSAFDAGAFDHMYHNVMQACTALVDAGWPKDEAFRFTLIALITGSVAAGIAMNEMGGAFVASVGVAALRPVEEPTGPAEDSGPTENED